MGRQIALLIRCSGKQLALYAMLLFVSLSFSMYILLDFQTGFAGRRIEFESNIQFVGQSRASLDDPTMPDDLKQLTQERIDALERMASAESDADLIRSASACYDVELRMLDAGYLVADEPALRQSAELFDGMSRLASPQAYDTSSQLPAVLVLSFISAHVPYIVWLLPGVFVGLITLRLFDAGRLLSRAPVSGVQRFAILLTLQLVLGAACVAITLLVPLVFALLRNGFGDVSYPVVFYQGGELMHLTALESSARVALLYLLLTIAISLFCQFVHCMVNHSTVAALTGAVVFLSPMLLQALLAQEGGDWILWCPFIYFYMPSSAGFFSYNPSSDVFPVEGASFGRGLMLIVALIAILLIAAFIADVFVRGVSIRRDRLGSQATGADASRGFVRASRITVARGRQAVLSDSSFSLDPGHVVGLVAPNGCGKTTLLEVLAGNASLLKSGSIKIAGVPCSRNPQYMQCVFLVPGNADWMYSHLSPDEHLALVTAFWGQAAGRVYDDACSELAEFRHKAVRKLSQGMKQQVALTLAYVSGARCLLLDESMNALDPTHVKWHSHTLRQYANAGGTVLISSHILSTLEGLCDDYLFIEDGAVCSKRPDGTVADYYAETFEKASGNVLP